MAEQVSGAYAYGRFLRAWQDAMTEFARHVVAGFEGLPPPGAPKSPEQLEQAREALYRQRIAQERRKGLAFVRAKAQQARRDLGLPQ